MSNISLLKPLIIATESEIRKKIFSDFNLDVSFIASEVDEDLIKENFQFKNYYDLAIELASAKALEVSKKNPDNYVLGVDQVCEFNNEILNKPGNKEKCISTLQKLSGNTHFQNCGMAIAFNDSIIWTSYDVAKLTMNELSLKDIENYISNLQTGIYYVIVTDSDGNSKVSNNIILDNLHVSRGWMDTSVSFGEPGYEERENISNGLYLVVSETELNP